MFRLYAVQVCLGSQRHRVAEEPEVDVGVEVQSQRAGIHARHAQFGNEVEVEGLALHS